MPAMERVVTLTIFLIREDLTEADCIDEYVDSEVREMVATLSFSSLQSWMMDQNEHRAINWHLCN